MKFNQKYFPLLISYPIFLSFSLFLFIYFYHKMFQYKETFNLVDLKNRLQNNLSKGVVTKLRIPMEYVKTEDCSAKCKSEDCIKMDRMTRDFENCIKCHENPKKCFRKSVIGGNCDDCLKDEKQIKCNDTNEFGCVPPHNINSYEGTKPYFIQLKSDNLNSPYDEQCIFCWQIKDYI
jgi:hypothetical protein